MPYALLDISLPTPEDLEFFRQAIHETAGIWLRDGKAELIQSRLRPRVQALGLDGFTSYRAFLMARPRSHPEWAEFVNALTTNKTEWFREAAHFDFLRDRLLPEWRRSGGGAFRVWSAACSTGEEPYTLAMILRRHLSEGESFEILGTDVNTRVLDWARKGVYPRQGLADIPEAYRPGALSVGTGDIRDWMRIRPELKARTEFKQFNLVDARYPWKDEFDLILLRNVLIYFAPDTIEQVIERMYDAAAPGGWLIVGHSESLQNVRTRWKNVASSVYRKEAPRPRPRKKRVLIVDDSRTIRELLARTIAADPRLEVVGTAADPIEAWEKMEKLDPDVLTLDIHMPRMDGVAFLRELWPRRPVPAVMVSAISLEEGGQVLSALEAGAVDYIQKPTLDELPRISDLIREKVHTAASVDVRRLARSRPPRRSAVPSGEVPDGAEASALFAIGASTGGTEALREVLCSLPERIPPILVVQHIPAVFSRAFAERLDGLCPFEVLEASDGDEVRPGRVLIAPGGKQMRLAGKPGSFRVRITDDAPVNRHRPSVDYLFDSVAALAGASAVAALLTGMGSDGARGLLRIRQAGGHTVAQDERSCVVFGMPREAIALGAAAEVVPLESVGERMMRKLSARKRSDDA